MAPCGTNGSSSAVRISVGHADAVDDAQRAGAVVVVGGIAEAVMRRRVGLVELAGRSRRAAAASSEKCAGKRRGLPAHPRLEVAHEIPLVDEVRAALERIHAARQVHASVTRRRPPSAPAAPRRRARRPASAPGCRRASSRRSRSTRMPSRSMSSRITNSGRASAPSDTGRATDARCRRSSAGSGGRRSSPPPRPCRRCRACSARGSIPRGRAAG